MLPNVREGYAFSMSPLSSSEIIREVHAVGRGLTAHPVAYRLVIHQETTRPVLYAFVRTLSGQLR
ncbi:MAG: hypothetical protein QOK48_2422 [Blastocatellia bacterium]|jgi:hypothetical protein|nr:hypothetical protein [Blastocatellia bacterium]